MLRNKIYRLTQNGKILGEFATIDELWIHARGLRITFDITREMIATGCHRSGSFSFAHNGDRYAVRHDYP
jgi:hypothetical protein